MADSKVVDTQEMSSSDAKWVKLKLCRWTDPAGKERTWEFAERPTRAKAAGVDGVAIFALLRSEAGSFPPSTIIIEQFRPPVNSLVIELPAGLIDEGETAEQAAMRELEEETGFKVDKTIETSPLMVCDPGMTSANMKMVMVDVPFAGELEMPKQKLDPGEFITARIVALDQLTTEFREYERKGYVIDARLAHFAHGYDIAQRLRSGKL